MKRKIATVHPKNEAIDLKDIAQESLPFITELGFIVVESSPNIVRYQRDGIEVEVYHEHISHEIGLGVRCLGVRYSLSDVIRAVNPIAAKEFRDAAATTPEEMVVGLKAAGKMLLRYGSSVMKGDLESCEALAVQRKAWGEEYALDVLTNQLRPQAEEAFRRENYLKVVELYTRIYPRLTPSEIKKLAIAKERSKG